MVDEAGVQRLLFILAWADCREASLLLAAGDLGGAASRVLDAAAKLEEVARFARQKPRAIWRPIVKLDATVPKRWAPRGR